MSKAIGIDLGTGFSAVAVMEGGEPTIIANSEGKRTTPSVVSFKDGERKVGDAANRQRIVAPTETISLIKRFMGVDYDKCGDIIKHMPYKVVNHENKPYIVVNDKEYTPEEISAMIIGKMKQTAEDYLGEEVKEAVITCPAWFDMAARQATKDAGEIAGLVVKRVINEPTAAILASNIKAEGDDSKIVLVADIGCGTTDFSVCELTDGMADVKASRGDVFLGGSDFDNAIVDWMIDKFNAEAHEFKGVKIDLRKDPQAMQRLIEAAEKAKIELSSVATTDINLPYITVDDNGPVHLVLKLSRATFEQLTSNLVKKIIEKGKEAMTAADVDASELNCVLLVGGSTRIPSIQDALSKTFNATLNKGVNPDEAVALGAAIQAEISASGKKADNQLLLLDVTPITMGIETMGGVMTPIVEADTTIPCKRSQIFSTAQDNQPSVDIRVLQGNRPMANQNKEVGLFRLDGIAPARRGVPQIEVSFDIDANGILNVTATDKGTGKEQHITIQSNSLSKDEIEKMKAEAEANAEADKKMRETADVLNKAETAIFTNEKLLEDLKDKISDEDKKTIEDLVAEMKKALEDKDVEKINATDKALTDAWQPISAKMYSQSSTEQPTSENATQTENNAETEEGNFEEVK